jgi:tetratricopeptide (TPR) repeat protein
VDAPVPPAADLLQRAVALARSAPLAQVLELFVEAERSFLAAGDAPGAAGAIVEEARLLAGSFEARHVRAASARLDRAAEVLGAAPAPDVRARLLHVRGYARFRVGDVLGAVEALREAERAFRDLGDPLGEARVLDTLGILWDRQGDRERAALLLARAFALKQEAGDPHGVAIALGNLGRLALHAGKPGEAAEFFRMDLRMARALGDRKGEAMVHVNASECAVLRGALGAAREHGDAALAIAQELHDGVAEGLALLALAGVARAGRDPREALRLIDEAEERLRAAGMPAGLAHARFQRAQALSALGDPDGAARAAAGAARAARHARLPELAIDAFLHTHQALTESEDPRRARRHLRRAQESAIRSGLPDLVARVRTRQVSQACVQAVLGTDARVHLDLAAGLLAPRQGRIVPLEIEGFLGQGAFAVVLLVKDRETGHRYALKRLQSTSERLRVLERRLRREFTAMARVPASPRLARPHAFGHEDGQPCLLVEYVEARDRHRSLEDLMGDLGRLPVGLTARVGHDVASALDVLHTARVVHRDVKPSNVLLDRQGRCVVTDYGLAYDTSEESYVPEEGFKGSVGYAAPEQFGLEGEAWMHPTPEGDLYSLGVILFQSLTGAWPFQSQGTILDVFRTKAAGRVDVSALAHVPDAMRDLVLGLLRPDPAKRAGPAASVANRLLAWTQDGGRP